MSYYRELTRTVQESIRSGRIGQPVFVRLTAGVAGGEADRWGRVLQLVSTAGAWVGSKIERVYAVEAPDRSHITVMLEFRGGAAGIVSTVSTGPNGPAVDALLLGNRGGIYHEGLTITAGGADLGLLPAIESGAALRAAIERSIRSGKPEAVGPEDER